MYFIRKLLLMNHTFREEVKLLQKSQWSKKEIEKIQLKRLKALVNHSYRKIPFYHEKMKESKIHPTDIKRLDDIKKLPVINKEEIKKIPLSKIVFRKGRLIKDSTSGSTGIPFTFYRDRDSFWSKMACKSRHNRWLGLKKTERSITFRSTYSGRQRNYLDLLFRLVFLNITLFFYNLNENEFKSKLNFLNYFKPYVINGYGSIIYFFTKFLQGNENIINFNLRHILSTAETLYDFQREIIGSTFNCKVFNLYNSQEFSDIAQECEEQDGLHICSEQLILEVIDNDEERIEEQLGKIVITDLTNYAMPFIRYNSNDLGILTTEICNCNRELSKIKNLEGRVNELIISKNGKIISGTMLQNFFRNYSWIDKFQVVQESFNRITLKIISGNLKDNDLSILEDNVENIFKKHLNEDTKVKIKLVKKIPTRLSGKYFVVESKVSKRFF